MKLKACILKVNLCVFVKLTKIFLYQVDELEEGVHRMHTIAEGLAGTRKELKTVGDAFAKVCSMVFLCLKP